MNVGHALIVLAACSFIATIYYTLRVDYEVSIAITNTSFNNDSSIFDTCPLVLYNHLDPQLLKFYHPGYNPKANCTVYEPLTELVGAQVHVNEKGRGYQCKARCILPNGDRRYIAQEWINLPSTKVFQCDVIQTQCTKNLITESFLHTQIYEQKDAQKISKPDVYLLIIDSASSFMVKRSLPKTLTYLKSMGGVHMEFLNKVGDNSKPNGFPLVFGKSIEGGSRAMVGMPPLIPDWDLNKICNEYLDNQSYHLFEYSKMGYKTMIAQDYGVGIVSYLNCLGFKRSEADHIWRPFDILRDEGTTFKKSFKDSCSEPHLEMLDYLEKFMKAYTGTPKIAQVWPTLLAHDTLKDLYHADEHFLKFFEKNRAIVDKSFFFFMGDHGPRFEGIREVPLGQYENLNPFLMVMIPSMYRNTSIHHQLYQKTNQLMTNFDLHATIMDILKLQPSTGFSDTAHRNLTPISKGSSLLREWRGLRNCRTLPIPSAYCICQYSEYDVTDRGLITKLGHFFANKLNMVLQRHGLEKKCRKQFYNKALSIRQIRVGGVTHYDMTVYLEPSMGLFSGNVQSNSSGLTVSSEFHRLNEYGKQGDCLVDNPLRPLCHCMNTTERPSNDSDVRTT